MMKIGFLFPGQGAQSLGMGKDIYEQYESAKNIYNKVKEITGIDIAKISFEGPEETLNETKNTQLAILTMSLAILGILKEDYKIELEIKQPNDIVYHAKKVGGILTETKLASEQVKYLVVGIGINTLKMQFTDDIKELATSIKKEFKKEIEAQEFIAKFCNKFEKYILERIDK